MFSVSKTKNITALIILSSLILVVGMGIFLAIDFSHNIGNHQTGCTFTVAEQVICTMNFFSFFTTWQKMIMVPLNFEILFLLLAFILFIGLFAYIRINFSGKYFRDNFSKYLQISSAIFSESFDPFIKLFSRGILHPKTP